jgi:hypothetical protein
MLARQAEEPPHARRMGLAQRLEQPLDHGPQHLVRLEVQRGPGQSGVAPVEERGAELVQPAVGPVQQDLDHGLDGSITRQSLQMPLDCGGCGFVIQGDSGLERGDNRPIIPPPHVTTPR